MMAPIERVTEFDRAEWLGWRPDFLGASEIPIVCGEATWGSQAVLFAEKKGLRPPPPDTGPMQRGRWGESAVFEALAETKPDWQVQRAHVHVRDTDRRIACTPDGFATAPGRRGIGIVQAKTIGRRNFRERWLDGPEGSLHGQATPPSSYRIQTITEMMLNEVAWGVLAVLVVGEFEWILRLFDVDRDQVIEDLICYHAHRFWTEHLDPNIMPPFEPPRDAELVRALFPNDDGTEIDLTTDNRALTVVEDLVQIQAAKKRLLKQEEEAKTELQGKLGTHTFGRMADGRLLSWKLQHRNGFTVAPADFRVFRILERRAK